MTCLNLHLAEFILLVGWIEGGQSRMMMKTGPVVVSEGNDGGGQRSGNRDEELVVNLGDRTNRA